MTPDGGGFLPDAGLVVRVGTLGALTAVLFGTLAATLRRSGWRVGYTRKVFHFGVFSVAAWIHARGGLPATNAYGGVVATLVLLVVARGAGNPLYDALARDKDRPHRSLFIVVPLMTTAVGGLLSALLAGPWATVGYLVAGWGDAVGEPVGVRWGRHPYRVPSLAGVPATRTWEGSAAVFVVGTLAATVALAGLGVVGVRGVAVAAAVGVVAAAVEGVSHHGTDNLTVPLAAALTARVLLG